MTEYIERQVAIEAIQQAIIKEYDRNYGVIDSDIVYEILDDLPAADVVPVVHGRWLPIVSYNNTYKCSECGRLLVDITDGLKMVAKHYPYCHCGAKMDEEE